MKDTTRKKVADLERHGLRSSTDEARYGLFGVLAAAVLSPLVTQLGEGMREHLADRRRRNKPCEHGRPGGRLCATCKAREDLEFEGLREARAAFDRVGREEDR